MKTIATLITLVWLLSSATVAAGAEDPTSELWEDFRDAHPYHVQVLGISAPEADDRRTLILSEPPPHVTLATVKALHPALASARTERHRIGADGWVLDIVASLPPLAPAELGALVDRLHQHAFRTTYKAHVTPLPVPDPPVSARPLLDLRVSAAELNAWLVTGGEPFRPLLGGPTRSVPEILKAKTPGVFVSAKPGLVAWSLPRGADLNRYTLEARQFALDSDLVIGAIGDRQHVVIVARERLAPLIDLPPLRTETMLLLAGVDTAELAQSYERNNFFAGSLRADGDWAPIYLSDALVDTEYGSLLNVTDQLLKSWSMNGLVEYVNFDYPAPRRWPFPKPLSTELGVKEVTFNWNTKGAGYVVQHGGYDVLALNRTGALPVSYFATSAKINTHEETAYEFFASVSDPNLTRVVQYAALYKIFREFGIRAPGVVRARHDDGGDKVLVAEALAMLKKLKATTPNDLMAKNTWLPADLRKQVRESMVSVQEGLKLIEGEWGAAGLEALALRIANPRLDVDLQVRVFSAPPEERVAILAKLTPLEQRNLVASSVALRFMAPPFPEVLRATFVDVDRVASRYATASTRVTSGAIRTPSIVLSRTSGEVSTLTGGHNLDSRILHYRASAEVAPGKVRITTEGDRLVILHNQADLPKLNATLRQAAIEAKSPRLKEALEGQLAKAPAVVRPRAQALLLPERAPDGLGRGLRAAHTDPPWVPGLGWRQAEASAGAVANPALELSTARVQAVMIERTAEGGYRVSHAAAAEPLTAGSYVGLTDMTYAVMRSSGARAADTPFRLHFTGFSESEASAFLRTMQVQFAHGKPPRMSGITTGRAMTPAEMRRAFAARPDFTKARITEVVRKSALGSGAPHELAIKVELPSVGQPSVFLRIRMFFHDLFQPSRETLDTLITRLFRRPGGPTDMGEAVGALQRELRALHPTLDDIRIHYESDAADILIVRVDQEDAGWTSPLGWSALASAR